MRPAVVLARLVRRTLPLGAALSGVAFAGCAMHGAALTPAVSPPTASSAVERAPSELPGRDLGRRAARATVYAAIALRFNHEADLENFVEQVSDPRSPRFRRFLTPAQFATRYAPTTQQQQRVVAALRRAGFTIVRTYANRCLIDASAPAAVAERFFRTTIHDFDQGRYGTRYANVIPLHVPTAVAPLVLAVELDSLVFARTAFAVAGPDAKRRNVIENPGFEKGMAPWRSCGDVKPRISRLHPYRGRFDALTGSPTTKSGAVRGFSAICQLVTIPRNGVLTAYTYSITNLTARGFQEIGLRSTPKGKAVAILRRDRIDRRRWRRQRWDLGRFAGRKLYVFFGVYGHGQKAAYNTMFVDNVSLIASKPSPSPSPSPSPTPVGPGPGAPLAGPTYGPDGGWAPRGVADGFDFPVQHGYDGRGATTAVIMQGALRTADLKSFLSYNQIVQTGTVTLKPVAGGPGTGDQTEGTLDVETIAGLAPGANVVVYETPDLSDQTIEDTYQTALNDRKTAVIDSPFTQCDSVDPTFDSTADADALQGAAIGMTFVAASGDEGSACYNGSTQQNAAGTNAPASGPHFLSVGGSQSIAPALAPSSPCPCPVSTPVAWNGANGAFLGASGGGISRQWPIPSYQQRVRGSPASSTQRNVPDIAFPAVDDDLFVNGTHELIGGTSWSSSIATALLVQTVAICGKLGFANPALYDAYARYGEGTMFVDVVSGSNKYASFPGYSAATGYDDVSGIGMPHGFDFAAALCGKSIASFR